MVLLVPTVHNEQFCAPPGTWLRASVSVAWIIWRATGGDALRSFRLGYRELMAERLVTERLVLRPWTADDAGAASASSC